MFRSDLFQKAKLSSPDFPIFLGESEFRMPFPPHWHEELEFLFFTNGQAIILCDNKEYNLKKGDLLIVNSGEIHSLSSSNTNLNYFYIAIDKSFIGYDFRYTHFKNFISDDKKMKSYFETIFKIYHEKPPFFEIKIRGLLCEVLYYISCFDGTYLIDTNVYHQKTMNAERIDKVLTYIEENYTTDISTDTLAALVNVSPSWLCHIFKNATGKSPINYLNSIRLMKAAELLKTTSKSVTEIVSLVGFSDISYFSRLFKSQYKLSPLKFKISDKLPSLY